MGGWVGWWVDGWMGGWVGGWMNEWVGGRRDSLVADKSKVTGGDHGLRGSLDIDEAGVLPIFFHHLAGQGVGTVPHHPAVEDPPV